jgi:predicted enzyme related to lactoylglutathione lyase
MKGTVMAKKKASRKAAPAPKAKAKTRARAKGKKAASDGQYNPALDSWITHTELASTDPDATGKWARKVLGWTFRPSFPMPDGSEYLLFMYSDKGGGGIRVNSPREVPGTVPYVQVGNVKKAFDKALKEGAEEMMPPSPVMADLVIAIVRAPGGVPIGLAGPK